MDYFFQIFRIITDCTCIHSMGVGGGYEAWQEPNKGHIQGIIALKESLFLYLSLSYRWRTHAKSTFSLNLFCKNSSLGSRKVRRKSTNKEDTSELQREA